MKKSLVLLVIVLSLVLAVPAFAGAPSHQASGGGTVLWPNGQTAQYAFTARSYADGSADGHLSFHNLTLDYGWQAEINCLHVVDGDAWFTGVVTHSDNPDNIGSRFDWWVRDGGNGPNADPDYTSTLFFSVPEDHCYDEVNFEALPIEWTSGNVTVK